MVRKVTVSLPDALLDVIDAEAAALGVSRSELVQEASAHYVAHTAQERQAEARRREVAEAVAGMREMAARYPTLDPRSSAEILREVREFDGGGPVFGTPERQRWEAEVGYAEWLAVVRAEDAGL